jgi:hypothetical protein
MSSHRPDQRTSVVEADQAYREPLRATLLRTVGIAVVIAAIVASSSRDLRRWPALTVVVLWPAFGGHWIDLWYLNWLRPRLPRSRSTRRGMRVLVWFVGGVVLGFAVRFTARALLTHPRVAWLTWATAGAAFVAIELVTHAVLNARGRPSFYNGLG